MTVKLGEMERKSFSFMFTVEQRVDHLTGTVKAIVITVNGERALFSPRRRRDSVKTRLDERVWKCVLLPAPITLSIRILQGSISLVNSWTACVGSS